MNVEEQKKEMRNTKPCLTNVTQIRSLTEEQTVSS